MWIIELTDAECEAVLDRAVVARLATCADSRPYIVPISVKYERAASDRFLYSFANLGRKCVGCAATRRSASKWTSSTIVSTGRPSSSWTIRGAGSSPAP
jgi:hypothetical protein